MNLDDARRAFLDLMNAAEWSEHHDGDVVDGKYQSRTKHTLTVSDRDLAILADALGLNGRIYETTSLMIQRHLLKTEAA